MRAPRRRRRREQEGAPKSLRPDDVCTRPALGRAGAPPRQRPRGATDTPRSPGGGPCLPRRPAAADRREPLDEQARWRRSEPEPGSPFRWPSGCGRP